MRSERKWVGSAAAITSVSPYYVQKISAFTGRPGHVLLNGYSEADAAHVAPTQSPREFVITYNGTLYESQAIEVFLEGYKKVADAFKDKLNFKLYFPGLAFDPSQRDKVLRHMAGYEHLLHITDRIPRAQVFDMQNASHAFLMVAHQGLKGIPSSKLYEYLNFKKPIILCPDDADIIHETLADTGLGVVCRDSTEVTNKLTRMAEDILNFGAIKLNYDAKNIEKYSRKSQVKVLADILHSI
jgi:glycosyltransferase involved in cell wall biosynthesis